MVEKHFILVHGQKEETKLNEHFDNFHEENKSYQFQEETKPTSVLKLESGCEDKENSQVSSNETKYIPLYSSENSEHIPLAFAIRF